jgi:transcription elongation GreA/GreB family factor
LTVVSADSPLGRALVGARVGDTVRYQAPAGQFTIKVTQVRALEDV